MSRKEGILLINIMLGLLFCRKILALLGCGGNVLMYHLSVKLKLLVFLVSWLDFCFELFSLPMFLLFPDKLQERLGYAENI